MRMKMLGLKPMLRNINGLSEGDRAYCGPYGAITCVIAAKNSPTKKRLFSVEGSLRMMNSKVLSGVVEDIRSLYTMKDLRAAICK